MWGTPTSSGSRWTGLSVRTLRVTTISSLSPPAYPGDHPCPTKGAAIQSHNDEDQSTLQRGTLGVRQERYGEAELHRVAPNRNRREGDIQSSGSKAAGEISSRLCPWYQPSGG